jgi:hypothetical protein
LIENQGHGKFAVTWKVLSLTCNTKKCSSLSCPLKFRAEAPSLFFFFMEEAPSLQTTPYIELIWTSKSKMEIL